MGPPLFERIKYFIDEKKRKKKWQRITAAMAILVFALTAYLLIYPALALVGQEGAAVGKTPISELIEQAETLEAPEEASESSTASEEEAASEADTEAEESPSVTDKADEEADADAAKDDDSKTDEKTASDKSDKEDTKKDAEKSDEKKSSKEKTEATEAHRSIPVTVVWDDEPTGNVEVKLLADGKEKETVLITKEDDWAHTFEDLQRHRQEDTSDEKAEEKTAEKAADEEKDTDSEKAVSKDIKYTIEAKIVEYDDKKLTEQKEDGFLTKANKRVRRMARAVAAREEKSTLEYDTKVTGSMAKGFEVNNMLRVANGVVPVTNANTYEKTDFYKENPLGIIGGFHLVGFESVQTKAHTNGNLLTNKLKYESNFGTNNLEKEVSYFRQLESNASSYVMGNDKNKSVIVIGKGINVGTADHGQSWTLNNTKADRPSKTNNPNGLWQDDTTEFVNLAQVKADTEQINRELSYYTENANVVPHLEDGNNQWLEILDPSGVNVFNLDPSKLSGNSPFRIRGFEKGKHATAIINVDLKGRNDFQLTKGSLLYYTDGTQAATSEVTEWQDGNVIWNFYDSSKHDRQYQGTLSNNEATTALMLAPNANYDIKSNLNGTVIAKNIIVSAESHRTDFTGKTIEHPLSFTKVGENNRPLSGATFELRKGSENGSVHATVQTTGNGDVTFRNLTKNTDYYLVETQAPPGYQKINTWIVKIHVDNRLKVTVTRNPSLPQNLYDPDTKKIKNTKEQSIGVSFTKVGLNNIPLKNATFELRKDHDNGIVHARVTTDHTGVLSFKNLEKNKTYYLVETNAPPGYAVINKWIVKVEVSGSGNVTVTRNPILNDYVYHASTMTIENKPIEKPSIKVEKVDKDNHDKKLGQAKFILEKYNPNTAEYEAVPNAEYTTDDLTGSFEIKDLTYNNAYRLKEIRPPNGYEMIKEYHEFLINHEDLHIYGWNVPKDFKGEYFTEPGTLKLVIENKKVTTEITILKKWLNANGDEVEKQSGEITVQLRKKINRNGQMSDVFVKDIRLHPGNNWQHTETGLPLSRPYTYWSGGQQHTGTETYTYYVKEVHVPDGYTVSYSDNNTVGITSGTLTVNNKAGFDTTLPSTGGSGTVPYRLAGFLLMLVGIALYMKKYSISKGGD